MNEPESAQPLPAGWMLAQYEILETLDHGATGALYKARDTRSNHEIALRTRSAGDAAARDNRFLQELRTVSSLRHPNIAAIIETGFAGDTEFISMEYVAGQTLAQIVRRGPVPWGRALRFAVQIADALAAAHEAGILHRNLSPDSIVITESGAVKVLDFGLARVFAETSGSAQPRTGAETAEGAGSRLAPPATSSAYSSPELVEGRRVDTRSDIFAFGAVLYEMVTGRLAFPGGTGTALDGAATRNVPPRASEFAPDLPKKLEKLIARCLRSNPARRYQRMDQLKTALERLIERADEPPRAPLYKHKALMIGGIAVALVAATGLWMRRSPADPGPSKFVQMTRDAGLATDPAISPDGSLIAYASDRATGRLQIWVQATAGGDARRLTGDDAEERNPSFSADGAQVAFRSERDGGGVYVAAARGGEARLVALGGRNPRFSPDGRWIAYWVREPRPNPSRIFAVPAGGGEPRAICAECSAASYPVWSPDSRRVLFAGMYRDQRDWWVSPLAGGEPQKTGAYEIFGMHGFLRGSAAHGWARNAGPEDVFVRPADWDGEIVLFSAALGGSAEVWRLPLPLALGQVSGSARPATSGGGWLFDPAVSSSGRLVFAKLSENVDVWALPLDPATGKSDGEPVRISGGASREIQQSVSRDGSKVIFQSDRSGRRAIWLRDLQTGKETLIAERPRKAYLAPGGNRVAYLAGDKVMVRPLAGGEPVAFCRGCRPLSWFHDDHRLLVHTRGTDRLFIADTRQPKERREILAVERPGRIMEASPSPDGKWIAFRALTPPSGSKVYIAPHRDSAPVERSNWITIAGEMSVSRSPEWSADGGLLYFLSERDGFLCVWAQRLERATKRPRGQPFAAQHFHNPRRTLRHDVSPDEIDFSVAGDKLVLSVVEVSGNIWMLEQ